MPLVLFTYTLALLISGQAARGWPFSPRVSAPRRSAAVKAPPPEGKMVSVSPTAGLADPGTATLAAEAPVLIAPDPPLGGATDWRPCACQSTVYK